MDCIDAVKEFHTALGMPVRERPDGHIPEARLRYALIKEELNEYRDALQKRDVVAIADALADILYVVYGAALCHGIPIQRVFDEVHRSNMTKFNDGEVKYREDGKMLKGDSYEPPKIKEILNG